MFNLTGQIAIVTGGARSIGKAITAILTDVGAKVAIADINSELAQETASQFCAEGKDVISIKTDISDRDSVSAMVKCVYDKWGRIDILVNDAGILQDKSL